MTDLPFLDPYTATAIALPFPCHATAVTQLTATPAPLFRGGSGSEGLAVGQGTETFY